MVHLRARLLVVLLTAMVVALGRPARESVRSDTIPACYLRLVRRLHRLVSMAVVALLSGAPALAVACGWMCQADAAHADGAQRPSGHAAAQRGQPPCSSNRHQAGATSAAPSQAADHTGAHGGGTLQKPSHDAALPGLRNIAGHERCCDGHSARAIVLAPSFARATIDLIAWAPGLPAPFAAMSQSPLPRPADRASQGPHIPPRAPAILRI
jgi:hypothetical protein